MSRLARVARELNPVYWPAGAIVAAGDLARVAFRARPNAFTNTRTRVPTDTALRAVMEWIATAQDAGRGGGIPAYFGLHGGFGPPYPETTGYLVPTLFDYADRSGISDYADRAVRAADWLLTLQFPSGAFPGGFARPSDGPSVFNTGQILFGMVAAWRRTGEERFRRAAINAGAWLVSVQSDDGAWRQHTYESQVHVYYTMVAWALAQLHAETHEQRFADAALRNVRWALRQQDPDGWLGEYNLRGRPIFLHFIAYALQGILETSILLEANDGIDGAARGAERLMRAFELRKRLAGAYAPGYREDGSYACVTGNSQMSLVWSSLAAHRGDVRFLNAALKMNELVKGTISYRGTRGVRGGVKGSDPIWGRYLPFRYPNWAAKFTADAFMAELSALERLAAASG